MCCCTATTRETCGGQQIFESQASVALRCRPCRCSPIGRGVWLRPRRLGVRISSAAPTVPSSGIQLCGSGVTGKHAGMRGQCFGVRVRLPSPTLVQVGLVQADRSLFKSASPCSPSGRGTDFKRRQVRVRISPRAHRTKADTDEDKLNAIKPNSSAVSPSGQGTRLISVHALVQLQPPRRKTYFMILHDVTAASRTVTPCVLVQIQVEKLFSCGGGGFIGCQCWAM